MSLQVTGFMLSHVTWFDEVSWKVSYTITGRHSLVTSESHHLWVTWTFQQSLQSHGRKPVYWGNLSRLYGRVERALTSHGAVNVTRLKLP